MTLKLAILFVLIASVHNYEEGARLAPGVPPLLYQYSSVPGMPVLINGETDNGEEINAEGLSEAGDEFPTYVAGEDLDSFSEDQDSYDNHEHHPTDDINFMDLNAIRSERDHLKEHMDLPIDTSKMSDRELQFYYFKVTDRDNNNELDGCELIKGMFHFTEERIRHEKKNEELKSFTDDELASAIDPIMARDDVNGDGMINFSEFVASYARDEVRLGKS